MSLAANGQTIFCDGPQCGAATRAPVALRAQLSSNAPSSAGWLFVSGEQARRHLCPRCAAQYFAAPHGWTENNERQDHV